MDGDECQWYQCRLIYSFYFHWNNIVHKLLLICEVVVLLLLLFQSSQHYTSNNSVKVYARYWYQEYVIMLKGDALIAEFILLFNKKLWFQSNYFCLLICSIQAFNVSRLGLSNSDRYMMDTWLIHQGHDCWNQRTSHMQNVRNNCRILPTTERSIWN